MYRLNKEAKDSGLPEGVEYPSEQAWIEPAAEGIGMAQTSCLSTHHARRAWSQRGAFAEAHLILCTDHDTASQKSNLQLWLLSSAILTPIRIFNITWKLVFSPPVRGDVLSVGLSAMVKAMKAWASDKTEEVNIQTGISLANTDQVRDIVRNPGGKSFPFREDKSKFKSKSWLDFRWLEGIYRVVLIRYDKHRFLCFSPLHWPHRYF